MRLPDRLLASPTLHPRHDGLTARPLRFWLGLLVVVCIFPGWVVAGALIAASYARERALVGESAVVAARTLMQVVDQELIRTRAALETLSTSNLLITGDLAAFHERALRVLPASGAAVIVLVDRDGNVLTDTQKPHGTKLPKLGELEMLKRVVATGKAGVSDLFVGSVSERYLINVEVPIIVDGQVTSVLVGGIPASQLGAFLEGQALSEGWLAGIVDRSARIVAGSRKSAEFVGHPAYPPLARRMTEIPEGQLDSRSLEGIDVLTAFSRSPISGWSVTIGIPRTQLNLPLRDTLWTASVVGTLLLLVGITVSHFIGRCIAGAISQLSASARALASGLPVTIPPVAITEVQEVGTAMTAAAELLTQRVRDREKAEDAERQVAISGRVVARFSALMEAVPDALVVVDGDGTIRSINRRGEAMFGYSRDELLGQPVELLIPEGIRAGHVGLRGRFFTAPMARPMGQGLRTLSCRYKDGSEIPVDVSLSPFELDGTPCVMAAVRDISERRQLEAELEANRIRTTASSRLAALGTMAGGVAHEINNPLAIIHAVADDLAEAADRGEASCELVGQNAARIIRLVDRIARIIKSLRHLARDGDNDPFVETTVAEIVGQALDVCEQKFKNSPVRLTVDPIAPDLRLRCSEVQISQVVVNLLQNAFDAAQERPGDPWVRLVCEVAPDRILLQVIDSGHGVSPELQARIMEPFFTTKPLGKGTGLGLSMSKQVAELHGGGIELTQKHGYTCFVLTLPFAGQTANDAAVVANPC